MRGSKWVAIGACVVFVLGAYAYLYQTVGSFNPLPQSTEITTAASCASGAGCAGFTLTAASLTVRTYSGVTSQELAFAVTPSGGGPMARLQVFVDNVSIGVVEGPFAAGETSDVSLGVPTTVNVTSGVSYSVAVEGFYVDAGTGQTAGIYWQTVEVSAS